MTHHCSLGQDIFKSIKSKVQISMTVAKSCMYCFVAFIVLLIIVPVRNSPCECEGGYNVFASVCLSVKLSAGLHILRMNFRNF